LVLHTLLERHERLREGAEKLATEIVSTPFCEDIASAVADAVTSLDIQDLNGRAGRTRYGYTEPTDAAWQLLEEALEDFVADRSGEHSAASGCFPHCRGAGDDTMCELHPHAADPWNETAGLFWSE
jgi:hypothetical protein